MEWNNPFNRCIECDDVVTNPICSECLAERMRIFVSQYDKRLAKEIKGFSFAEGETNCIICHRKMSLCAHCFSKGIYDFLEERNHLIAQEFVSRFDFELREALTQW